MSFYQSFARILISSTALASPCFGALERGFLCESTSGSSAAVEASESEGDKMLRLINEIYSVKFSGEFPKIQKGDKIESGFKISTILCEKPGETPVQTKVWHFLSLEQTEDFRSRIDFLLKLVVSYSNSVEIDQRTHNRKTSKNSSAQAGVQSLVQTGVQEVVDELFAIAKEAVQEGKISEASVVNMYRYLVALTSMLEKQQAIRFNEDLLNVFRAIQEWVWEYIPHSHMLPYFNFEFKNNEWRASFKYSEYKKEKIDSSKENKKIQGWLANPKVREEDKNILRLEFHRIANKPVKYSEANDAISALRDREQYHHEVMALLDKWSVTANKEMAEKERAIKEKAEAKTAKSQPPVVDRSELEETNKARAELGLPPLDDANSTSSKPAGRAKKPTDAERKAQSLESKQRAEERRKAGVLGVNEQTKCDAGLATGEVSQRAQLDAQRAAEEEQRLVQLAATQAANAEKNASLMQRQQDLAARKAAEEETRAAKRRILLERKYSWIDILYAAQQNLAVFSEDKLVDPSIFEGAADFKAACDELKAKGICVELGVHRNEQCVAMWTDINGRKHMKWFHTPHGSQLVKGSKAGWSVGLKQALRDTGRLLMQH